jgi:hypothetical protein
MHVWPHDPWDLALLLLLLLLLLVVLQEWPPDGLTG